MSIQAIAHVLDHSESQGSERCVLIAIANHVDAATGDGWAYVEQILEEANCHEDTYRRAVKRLVTRGELAVASRQGGSPRVRDAYRPNLYRLLGFRETLDPRKLQRADGPGSPPQFAEYRPPQDAEVGTPRSAEVGPPQPAEVLKKEPSLDPSKEPSIQPPVPRTASTSRTEPEAEAEVDVDRRGAQLVAEVAARLDNPAAVKQLYAAVDAGGRITLGRVLVDLVDRVGWPVTELAAELAGVLFGRGLPGSVVAVLLTRARTLVDTAVWIDRLDSPGIASLDDEYAAAVNHGRTLAATGLELDLVVTELDGRYPPGAFLDAALAGAGLIDATGEPTPELLALRGAA